MKTIEVSRLLGFSRNALRLYEDMGLLTNIRRSEAGYRCYDVAHIEDLIFLQRAKAAGFTLNEIKALLKTGRSQALNCAAVSKSVKGKVAEIEAEISTLKLKAAFLQSFVSVCEAAPKSTTCRITRVGFDKKSCCASNAVEAGSR